MVHTIIPNEEATRRGRGAKSKEEKKRGNLKLKFLDLTGVRNSWGGKDAADTPKRVGGEEERGERRGEEKKGGVLLGKRD